MAKRPGLPSNLRITADGVDDLLGAVKAMAKREVLVGFPEDTTGRDDTEDLDITNAALAYIHDNGAPEQNIPARPFMVPAMTEVQDDLADEFEKVARAVLKHRNPAIVDVALTRVGMMAELAIKKKINEGIPPPLSEWTLRDRARRGRKGAKMELEARARGDSPSTQLAKPLIDTAQMRNAVKYVIRDRKRRR